MSEERFIKLVEEQNGFELVQAYRDDVDHIIGGKGNTFWFITAKNGSVRETRIGKLTGGAWSDTLIKGKGVKRTEKALKAGSTIELIEKNAYLMQDEVWAKKDNPRPIEDAHPHYHYVYGFGEKGLDVSVQYGVTIGYSDINSPEACFHLRDLSTGKDVELS